MSALICQYGAELFLTLEEVLGLLSFDELLGEDVSSGLRRLVHADALHHALGAGLRGECCDCFLCHNLNLLI